MPNHIQNKIIADASNMRRIRDAFCNADGEVDFNRLIRMPEHIEGSFYADGSLGKDDEKSHQDGNWYEWSIACWGTKWGAYQTPDKRDDAERLYFQTAWSMPRPILSALAARLESITFEWHWADEDIGSNLGTAIVRNGLITFRRPDDPRAFALDLHQWAEDEA